jgi:hypothetical protein
MLRPLKVSLSISLISLRPCRLDLEIENLLGATTHVGIRRLSLVVNDGRSGVKIKVAMASAERGCEQ